jgi:hypothetical protein
VGQNLSGSGDDVLTGSSFVFVTASEVKSKLESAMFRPLRVGTAMTLLVLLFWMRGSELTGGMLTIPACFPASLRFASVFGRAGTVH